MAVPGRLLALTEAASKLVLEKDMTVVLEEPG